MQLETIQQLLAPVHSPICLTDLEVISLTSPESNNDSFFYKTHNPSLFPGYCARDPGGKQFYGEPHGASTVAYYI
jgi:hypothetical protein